ncbi:thiamine phosphate synthase [Campylobacter sp. MIT 21-1685]|uniref:thiamine phosphate synthase n=1 Tax=unclassified Campylobacter TaxID=2593542 RepID=UPI00224B288B|nr:MULTISPECIES: thiamine phosphate synthase [unclassified Campylobacter]MCX2683162.1 thiamine phosphate synthase [Campylobacter sp. MIT 21-1684]MCX2751379.1 thiamine phosphate synthase [Campylobacter sp. MIT 21-1682]MCX2807578.1 thiamine phosphate synthase [Campylobacter sp. MIT 21-1685]
MWAKKIIAISDRKNVQGDFLQQVENLTKYGIDALVLREKDLSACEYHDLAKEILQICRKNNTTCILHSFHRECLKLGHRYFHAPLPLLCEEPKLAQYFHLVGTSIHSEEEFVEAIKYNVQYAFIGHIFQSTCKSTLKPKGLDFLNSILQKSTIPLYAIGGIKLENISELKNKDIAGICMREALMKEKKVQEYLKLCRQNLNE